jgi:hypothetical protein
MTDIPDAAWAFPAMRARMVRPGEIGITISETEYVMPVSQANELIGVILRAKHDGVEDDDRKA